MKFYDHTIGSTNALFKTLKRLYMAKNIDFYFGVSSPWTYLAGPRFRKLVQRNKLVVNWKPFDVSRVFSLTGTKPVKERPSQIQANRLTDLARWRSFLKMDLNLQPKFFPVNNLPAARMIISALQKGVDVMDLANAYMTAVWVQERDISDPETLIAIANEQGLDGTSMLTRVEDNSVMKELDGNGQEAIDRNVFGTPTWIYKEELFWGQDRLEFLTRAVESSD